jgi:membrane protein implicated in regulation of membrane protease activity
VYQQAPGTISYIPLMPEWYLLIFTLGILSVLGILWAPMFWVLPVFFLAQVILFMQAGISAAKSLKTKKYKSRLQYFKFWGLTTVLHIVQPFARLYGRIAHGLTPWRKRGSGYYKRGLLFKNKLSLMHWSEKWKSMEEWLQEIEINLIKTKARVRRSGQYDRWDLEVNGGFFSGCRGLLTIEEHGGGKQLLRFKCSPHYSKTGFILTTTFSMLSFIALMNASYLVGGILGACSMVLMITYFTDKARAMHDLSNAFSFLSKAETTVSIFASEIIAEPKEGLINESITVSELSSNIKVIKKYTSSPDFRQHRILEQAIENDNEVNTF